MGQIDPVLFFTELLWGGGDVLWVAMNVKYIYIQIYIYICLVQELCSEIQFCSVNQCGSMYFFDYVIF